MTRRIVVASHNPVKIDATLQGFRKMFPGEMFEVVGVSVPSGVSDQPQTSDETLQGALHRAEQASQHTPDADFWVGIEGGVEAVGDDMEVFAWIAVRSREGVIGRGRGGTFFVPPAVAALVRQGKELGEADDIVFQKTNSKQDNGAIGILTHDIMTRTAYYIDTLVLALIPFKNPNLYTGTTNEPSL